MHKKSQHCILSQPFQKKCMVVYFPKVNKLQCDFYKHEKYICNFAHRLEISKDVFYINFKKPELQQLCATAAYSLHQCS